MTRRPAVVAMALVLGLLAGACTPSSPADPEEALVDTVRRTFDAPFAYRLVAEADREALSGLGDELGSVAARLNLVEVAGVVDGEVASADVTLLSTRPVLQLRRFGDEEVYVRAALDRAPLSSVATPELEGRLLGLALQTDQPRSVVTAIEAVFDSQWIGVEGAIEPIGEAGEGDPDLSTPLPQVVADYLVVRDQQDDEGDTTFRVDLQVRELLRALAALGGGPEAAGMGDQAFEEGLAVLPETVTGDVVVGDEVVQQIVFDVAAAARRDGVDIPGSLELRLELSDHGDTDRPETPQAAVVVPSRDLTDGLQGLFEGPRPESPTSVPTDPAPSTSPTSS